MIEFRRKYFSSEEKKEEKLDKAKRYGKKAYDAVVQPLADIARKPGTFLREQTAQGIEHPLYQTAVTGTTAFDMAVLGGVAGKVAGKAVGTAVGLQPYGTNLGAMTLKYKIIHGEEKLISKEKREKMKKKAQEVMDRSGSSRTSRVMNRAERVLNAPSDGVATVYNGAKRKLKREKKK